MIPPLVRAALCADEIEVLWAEDRTKGLQLAVSESPELILLDVSIPEMNGYELREHLATLPETHDTPVMFLSAAGNVEQRVRGLDAGACDYIVKPFAPQELGARVRVS